MSLKLCNIFIVASLFSLTAYAASLNIVNSCQGTLFLSTETTRGSIANNVNIPSHNVNAPISMDISDDWVGVVNVGYGCNAEGTSCKTGGPIWDGRLPFTQAQFSFSSSPAQVTYAISQLYGINAGVKINMTDTSCPTPSCVIVEADNCPVTGPQGPNHISCYSPCCASAADCENGALQSGGCVNNEGLGPSTGFYHKVCPNAIAFPDDESSGDNVQFSCGDTDVTLTTCPGKSTTSHI